MRLFWGFFFSSLYGDRLALVNAVAIESLSSFINLAGMEDGNGVLEIAGVVVMNVMKEMSYVIHEMRYFSRTYSRSSFGK